MARTAKRRTLRWRYRNGSGRHQLNGVAWCEHLVGRSRALDTIDAIAAMGIPVEIPRVQDDVVILRAPQRIGFDTARASLIVEIDAQAIRGGEANDFEMGPQGRRNRRVLPVGLHDRAWRRALWWRVAGGGDSGRVAGPRWAIEG